MIPPFKIFFFPNPYESPLETFPKINTTNQMPNKKLSRYLEQLF